MEIFHLECCSSSLISLLLCSLTLRDSFLQNDFSFEKRDWMSIHLDELPEGSQLVRDDRFFIESIKMLCISELICRGITIFIYVALREDHGA